MSPCLTLTDNHPKGVNHVGKDCHYMMFSHRPNGSGIMRGFDPGWKLVKGTVTIRWGSTLQFHRIATARFQVVFELTEHQAIIGYLEI